MTREEYDIQSANIRRQIKNLKKQQKCLDREFISELPVKIGDEVEVAGSPAIIDDIRVSSTPPYKLVGVFKYKYYQSRRFERNFANPYIRFKK